MSGTYKIVLRFANPHEELECVVVSAFSADSPQARLQRELAHVIDGTKQLEATAGGAIFNATTRTPTISLSVPGLRDVHAAIIGTLDELEKPNWGWRYHDKRLAPRISAAKRKLPASDTILTGVAIELRGVRERFVDEEVIARWELEPLPA